MPKIGYFTKLDPELREAMARYKSAIGVPEAVQIDRAMRAWLADRPEAELSATPRAPKRIESSKVTAKRGRKKKA